MFTGTSTRRTNETSSDLCLPDLPHTRPDHPQVRPTFFSASGFDRTLEQLSGLHLRLTLCRLTLDATWGKTRDVAEALQGPLLMIRAMDDDSLLILYVGPRRGGAEGDLDAERAIGDKLHRVLDQVVGTGGARVSMAHYWSDAMDLRSGFSDPQALVAAA